MFSAERVPATLRYIDPLILQGDPMYFFRLEPEWWERRQIGDETEYICNGIIVAYSRPVDERNMVCIKPKITQTITKFVAPNQEMGREVCDLILHHSGEHSACDRVREICEKYGFCCNDERGRLVNAAVGALVYFKWNEIRENQERVRNFPVAA